MKKILIIMFIAIIMLSLFGCNVEDEFVIPEGTKFVAHRGLSSTYYQNSEAAFKAAGESDFFFAIETDIWRTNDGIWVCAHDIDPFQDKSVKLHDITYNQAVSIPLDPNLSGEAIVLGDVYLCDLERYLDICIEYNKMPFIEIKYVYDVEYLEELLEIIESKINLDRVQFISFEMQNINNLKSLDKKLRLQILTSNSLLAVAYSKNMDIGVRQDILTENLIETSHSKGYQVNVWTVNDQELVDKYINWGVDYITTDYIYDIK